MSSQHHPNNSPEGNINSPGRDNDPERELDSAEQVPNVSGHETTTRSGLEAQPADIVPQGTGTTDDQEDELPDDDLPVIVGITIGRRLKRGRFTAIYQGTRAADGSPVVVKSLLRTTSQDFRQRFQNGCSIHSSVRHTSIIPLLYHLLADHASYVVTPLLPHGTLADQLTKGMTISTLLKVIKHIALALHHLHLQQIVHNDVKPENILFSVENKAYLADFDLAHHLNPDLPSQESVNQERSARENVDQQSSIKPKNSRADQPPSERLHVTPEYAAPELLSRRRYDGRADLYSLGIVMYHMLVGELPFKGNSDVETAQRQLQDPVPRLPGQFIEMQPLMERLLAKRPEQRIKTGQEIAAAIDALRHSDNMIVGSLRTEAINTREIRAITDAGLLATSAENARSDRQCEQASTHRGLRWAVFTVLCLVGIGYGGYRYFDQSQLYIDRALIFLGIGEDPQLAAAWNDAQSLRQDTNQALSTIAAAYRRVLALSPDHPGATTEMAALASDWKAGIAQALDANELEAAETKLAEAGSVFPNDLEWVQLATQLTDRERAERIIANTGDLLTSHGLSDLPSATAAIQSYQEVLRLAPEHPIALQALRALGIHYAEMASSAANRGEVNLAISLLERATAADRTVAILDDARKLISQATTAQTAIEDLLQQARRLRSQGLLIGPTNTPDGETGEASESAAELYHRVLAIDIDNVIAQQSLVEITSQVTATADQLLAQGDLIGVDKLVNRAAAAGLDEVGVNEMRRRLDQERSRQQAITENLSAARALMANGLLTAPIEDNAVARLREVQQIDPGNIEATQMLRACADRLAGVAKEAHSVALLDEAKQYLDLALAIVPDVPEWVSLRESWEQVK